MIRTFLAIELDEHIKNQLVKAQHSLGEIDAHVRWVEPENLHLTVKFLGYVRDEELPKICDVAEAVVGMIEPFDFSIEGLTSAPPTGQMRMVWARIDEPTGRLQKMYEMLEDAFDSMGFKRENRLFHPHMTLGRVKSGRNVNQLRAAVADFADADFGIVGVDELVVFASELTGEGPIYSPLRRAPLGK
jgi:RNA 2',3'-cyclic 3'-phosphodiesterase